MLDDRQIQAAERLKAWGMTDGPEVERRTVTIEVPEGGRVSVVPRRTGENRCEVTWRELAADPLGALAGVQSVLGAVREFEGQILPVMSPEQAASLVGRPELPPHGGEACQRRPLTWLLTVRGPSSGAWCQGCGRWLKRDGRKGEIEES